NGISPRRLVEMTGFYALFFQVATWVSKVQSWFGKVGLAKLVWQSWFGKRMGHGTQIYLICLIFDQVNLRPVFLHHPSAMTARVSRTAVSQIYVDDKIKEYVLDLIIGTREPEGQGLAELRPLIAFGASPRAGIFMILAARAHAFLQGRGFVTPEDIKQIAPDVLRHRIITTYEAEAEEVTTDEIVRRLLARVEVP
ncbi:MAG: hypothetical protein KDE56_30640, partial [Anaerolineales bacterium]|nr:hypothetical protein [Anaerolineales bacterium]